MTKDEALTLALEALEVANSCVDGYYIPKGKTQLPEVEEAITAIREALAQPEQEPVAWADVDLDGMAEAFYRVIEAHATKDSPFYNPVNSDAMMALRVLRGLISAMKQYTPPQRKPLTEEEIDALALDDDGLPNSHLEFARAIEAKLREKNA